LATPLAGTQATNLGWTMDLQVTFRAEGRLIGSVDNWPLARPIH